MSEIQVKVPDIGDFKDVAVIEVLVQPGDTVKVEQSLITVESDKASMEIPSSHAGVVKSLAVKLGDTVNEGSVVLTLDAAEAAAAPTPPPLGEGRVGAAPASSSVAEGRERAGVRAKPPAPQPHPHPNPLPPAGEGANSPHLPQPPATAARPTWTATSSSSAAAPVATRPPSVRPTWA